MNSAKNILRGMTLEQKVAQLLCIMVIGEGFDNESCKNGMGD